MASPSSPRRAPSWSSISAPTAASPGARSPSSRSTARRPRPAGARAASRSRPRRGHGRRQRGARSRRSGARRGGGRRVAARALPRAPARRGPGAGAAAAGARAPLHRGCTSWRCASAGGEPLEEVVERARPPIHFRRKASVRQALQRWPAARLAAALGRLLAAEIGCKTTGWPAEALCRRAALGVCQAARAGPAAPPDAVGPAARPRSRSCIGGGPL